MAGRFITTMATLGLAIAVGYGGWQFAQRLGPEATGFAAPVSVRLGAARLRVEPAYVRDSEDRRGGALDRLDIAARFPNFAPAGGGSARADDNLVFIRLEEADASLAPEERAAKLYVRFLETEQWSNPGGLAMRRFEPGSPYEHEELYYTPPEGRLFAARCTRPRQPPDGLAETCLFDLRINGVDAHVRFSPELLAEWERLSRGARALVERLTR